MPAKTPIARTKTAALSRVADCVSRGYILATVGKVPVEKAIRLANKFHERYAIGATVSQRSTRKHKGLVNAILVLYWPPEATEVHWLLMATGDLPGEKLQRLDTRPRLQWLGYELVRHTDAGDIRWTWKRSKGEMRDAHAHIRHLARQRAMQALGEYLQVLGRQPGFHGVRIQTKELCDHALQLGYRGELPTLFYVQKVSHGDPLLLTKE